MQAGVGNRRRVRRSLSAIEHGEFAKKLAVNQFRKCYRLGVLIDHPDAHRTTIDYVKRITLVILVEDGFAGAESHLLDARRQTFEFVAFESLEKCHARKALGSIAKRLIIGLGVFV